MKEGKVGPLIFTLTWIAGLLSGGAIVYGLVVMNSIFGTALATLGILVMMVVAVLYEQSRKDVLYHVDGGTV